MIFIVDLNHDLNHRFKSLDLNHIHLDAQQFRLSYKPYCTVGRDIMNINKDMSHSDSRCWR